MEAAVEVRELHVVRGGRDALRGLTVDVAAGRITGLLGPSGCGKSTLMRAIVGVQRIRSGTVRVLGRPAGSPGLRRRIGYMTQAPSVYGDLTVAQNLRFFARVLGAPAAQPAAVLETVDLADYAGRRADDLSGGQRARVSLAVALLGDPQVLVLDEPTVGLDPLLRRDLWGTFRTLADAGRTLVVSSHVMDEATHCDDLLLLRDGVLLAAGAPDELRSRTGTRDVEAAFLALVDEEPAA